MSQQSKANIRLNKTGAWTMNGMGTDLLEGNAEDVISDVPLEYAIWMRDNGAATLIETDADAKTLETKKPKPKTKVEVTIIDEDQAITKHIEASKSDDETKVEAEKPKRGRPPKS